MTRRRARAGAALVVVLAAAAAGVAMLAGRPSAADLPGGVVYRFDARTGEMTGRFATQGNPCDLAADAQGGAWVSDLGTHFDGESDTGAVSRVGDKDSRVELGETAPCELALTSAGPRVSANEVPNRLLAVEPADGEWRALADPASDREEFHLVAAAGTSVWTAGTHPSGVSRFDARSGRRTGSVRLPGRLGGLVVADEAVWASTEGGVVRIDPDTLAARRFADVRATGPLAVAAGGVWVFTGSRRLLRLDARTARETDRLRLQAAEIRVGGGALWLLDEFGDLTRIDLRSRRARKVATLPGDGRVFGLAADDRSVWAGRRNMPPVES